jgi:hypothetical protein
MGGEIATANSLSDIAVRTASWVGYESESYCRVVVTSSLSSTTDELTSCLVDGLGVSRGHQADCVSKRLEFA